jgi:hypothetical protein
MTELEITIGFGRDYRLQCWQDGATTPPAGWQAGDALFAYVYPGQDLAATFNPAVAWYTAGGTQTGYDQAQVLLSILATESSLLTPGATYTVLISRLPAGSTDPKAIWRGTLKAVGAPGTAAPTVKTYCTYQDMLDNCGWVEMLMEEDDDTAGFLVQRLKAREWMDWCILNNYRGAYVGNFETHSTLAFAFGYAGWRRSLGPSPSLIDYLAQDKLILRPQIVEACSYYASALIGLKQVGTSNQYSGYGAYARDMAERVAIGTTAEIDLTGNGIGSLFINLSSTNSLFT